MPTPVINRHNPDQWKADSEASVDYYNRSCKSASLRPLDALSCWLNNHGYSCVRPRSLDEMAPGEFASHVNVKGRGPSDDDRRGNIPVDFAIMPKTARKGSLPILIEAKTSDSFPFSNRGCRFAIAKAGTLKNILGRDVSLILHLAGYFDPGYLGRIASEGIDWMWQHRIGDFHKLLSNRSLN